jgi:uncharacterized phage-like protein YoqJ
MELRRETTCCFTGHRPEKLPWGADERDPRCLALKASMAREIEGLYRRGFRHFISGMARGADLYFAEAALSLREKYPELTVEGAVPCQSQAERWTPEERRRWRACLDKCDLETVVQQNYDRWCMHRRDRYMVDRSAAILAVFDGTPGGTMYTLNYAMDQRLEILLLDLNHPGNRATRLEAK